MLIIILFILSVLCFVYVGLLLVNPHKYVNLLPPRVKEENE